MSRYLGFDYGVKRIGLAVGDSITRTARPLKTIANDWKTIELELSEWQPDACIIGLPIGMDGEEQDITRAARKFAITIQQRGPWAVHLCDERMSSASAESMMRAQRASGGLKKRVKREQIDSQAASIILQQWMDDNP